MASSENAKRTTVAEYPDEFVAMVRAYVPIPVREKRAATPRAGAPASDWTLVFDTETTTDEAQSLRFGAYQLRHQGKLVEHGIFYDPEGVVAYEREVIKKVALAKGARLMTRSEFVDEVFFEKAYELRALIIGFNLPFDLSRIAVAHDSARGKMKGGFTFKFSTDRRRPRIQVRHLNSRAALIQFSLPRVQRTPRGARKRGLFTPARRGTFVDVKTLAAALLSRSFSLDGLANHLATQSRKHVADEHGTELSERYVEYALQDVQVTWECYEKLEQRFAEHGLRQTISKILSEASLGKAYLSEMGVRSFQTVQPDFPNVFFGYTMSAYYGGRSEVRWRRTIKQVLYCDFLSMYPTVCTLMKLWRFVIAKGVNWRETTQETQTFLNEITLADLLRSETWPRLHTLVQLRPNEDILPLRVRYDGISPTIGLNEITSDQPFWYTLADVIASRLLSGRTPRIIKAISFEPREPQDDLRPIRVGGSGGELIEPLADDFYRKLIDIRSEIKARWQAAPESDRPRLDAEQLAAKILANATSYGIFVEVNATELDHSEKRPCFGQDACGFEVETRKNEEPGPFFHPLIATLITGAARLMLAMAESLGAEAGLDWAFCDTDSMAFAKPDEMPSDEFFAKAQAVARSFDKLNPYEKPGPLLKIENANFGIGEAENLRPLYAFCISSKRYVLFNIFDDGTPIIRKASAHGLGHLRAPYEPDDAPPSIPTPSLELSEIGVARWHYDLWFQIIKAALAGHPTKVDLAYHPSLSLPAMSRYGATTPDILRWMDAPNAGKRYCDQVKPFGFLAAFQAAQNVWCAKDVALVSRKKGRPLRPIAPFNKDPLKAANQSFDRETSMPILKKDLRSYASALAQYHLSPETKFRNGDFLHQGRTERRSVRVVDVSHIGKEADKLEEQYFLGVDEKNQIDYGNSMDGLEIRVRERARRIGLRCLARTTGVSRMTLRKVLRCGVSCVSDRVRMRLRRLR